MGRKKLPPKEMFEIYIDYLAKGGQEALVAQARGLDIDEVSSAVKEVEEILYGDKPDDPQRTFQIINQYLLHIEHIISQVLFAEYNRWISKLRKEQEGGEEVSFPDKLVETAREMHRIILNRGQFLLKVYGAKMKGSGEGSDEEILASIFETPPDLPSME